MAIPSAKGEEDARLELPGVLTLFLWLPSVSERCLDPADRFFLSQRDKRFVGTKGMSNVHYYALTAILGFTRFF